MSVDGCAEIAHTEIEEERIREGQKMGINKSFNSWAELTKFAQRKGGRTPDNTTRRLNSHAEWQRFAKFLISLRDHFARCNNRSRALI